jgi:hypothetical protein
MMIHPGFTRVVAVTWLAGVLLVCGGGGSGCATIRVTDPPRTATEQFLLSLAATQAIEQLSAAQLRDRRVFIDSTYLTGVTVPTGEFAFMLGELRSRMLAAGVRLVNGREQSEIILEVRSGGLGIDRAEFLLGIPALYLPQVNVTGDVPLATPELAIVKSTRQRGYAAVAFVAFWSDTGELVASSGPFIGRTHRDDFWFFGVGPRTVGDIPPAQR